VHPIRASDVPHISSRSANYTPYLDNDCDFFRILLERKYFGAFTERAFWIEMIKIDAGAEWLSTSEGARRLIVALSGAAAVNGTEIGQLTAIQADAGETLHVSATEETVLYIVGLPPVRLPSTPSDQFDVIESHVVIQQGQPIAAAIQFENPNAGRPTVPTARRESGVSNGGIR
jgi:hypothetical protein